MTFAIRVCCIVSAATISIFAFAHADAQSKQKNKVYPLKPGTVFRVRLDAELRSDSARVGDRFTTTVADAVISDSGVKLVPAGTTVHGRVTGVSRASKRVAGSIGVSFYSLEFPNRKSVVIVGNLVPTGGAPAEVFTIGPSGGGISPTKFGGTTGKDVVVKTGTEIGVSLSKKISLPKYQ